MPKPLTRTQWLRRASSKMRPWLKAIGYPVIGPITFYLSPPDRHSANPDIAYWSPIVPGPRHLIVVDASLRSLQALAAVLHEMCHAATGPDCHHDEAPFSTAHAGIGFTKRRSACVPQARLTRLLKTLSQDLGPYPKE